MIAHTPYGLLLFLLPLILCFLCDSLLSRVLHSSSRPPSLHGLVLVPFPDLADEVALLFRGVCNSKFSLGGFYPRADSGARPPFPVASALLRLSFFVAFFHSAAVATVIDLDVVVDFGTVAIPGELVDASFEGELLRV
jgi:hypothetical protein